MNSRQVLFSSILLDSKNCFNLKRSVSDHYFFPQVETGLRVKGH